MADEIELKLALPASQRVRFLRLPQLKQASSRQTEALLNIYYDTPALDLLDRGIALRLRRTGERWLQTVKCKGSATGGLATRPEWETGYQGRFDFSQVSDPEVRKWLDRARIRERLTPIFETRVHRTTWSFTPEPGSALRMMLDHGWVIASGRQDAISEVEIELDEGLPVTLFRFAESLAAKLPLVPALRSKAERGYRLFNAVPEVPVKAQAVRLWPEMSPSAAFRAIASACLDHLQHNYCGAVSSTDPEYIHQMRVATRRLRSAMRLFEPVLPAEFSAQVLPELRRLMRRLGTTRDLDVLREEIVLPVAHALPEDERPGALLAMISQRQDTARAEALDLLGASEYGLMLLRATRLLHELPNGDGQLAEFAHRRLGRLRRKTSRLAAAASPEDSRSVHTVRIAVKQLRYALEFFASLPGFHASHVVRRLTAAQGSLGKLNDFATAGDALMKCAGEDRDLGAAVSLIGNWHLPAYRELSAGLPEQLAWLSKLRLPLEHNKMELILWRHAEAEDIQPGMSDDERRLTAHGEKQAKDMAHWLRKHLPKHTRILVSPARRTQQTAEALGLHFITEPRIGTAASPEDLIAAAGWPNGDATVLLVGHQPSLGQLAALLLSDELREWTIKKGAVCWVSSNGSNSKTARLKAALSVDLL